MAEIRPKLTPLEGGAMHKSLHRGAAKIEHPGILPDVQNLSWDDIRIFLACARDASFRKAAATLGLSSSTVVRRIERLESALEMHLFDRVPDGVLLTPVGETLLKSGEDMERAIFDILRTSGDDDLSRGTVTISITEGLGSYWVMPQLVEFQRHSPHVVVNLRCAMENADVLRLEADMAIQFERPPNPELIAVKLGRLHVYPFAAQTYIDTYGMPKSAEEMLQHRLVHQAAPQLDDDAWARFLGVPDLDSVVCIRTNSSTAHFYAVEKGAGIGVLPTFATALGAPVVPVDIGGSYFLDIWLTYHPDVRKTPRKAIVIDWIKSIFDPKTHPWFRNSFIHPNDLLEAPVGVSEHLSGRGFFAAAPLANREPV